ncbi:hypothetical protein [Chromobacterium haemolyticum]|uniref:hypothetical protein n=1 Tax=Chromobacterium haemolyticum TaxID=394935 RepID=UPI0005BC492C|nr:hypothetical protein [Chromobacterium haemolyticum]
MTCNCTTEFTAKMAERATKQLGVPAKAEYQNATQLITKNLDLISRHFVTFKITADKPGYRKGKDTTFAINFCPFCGTKVED